MDNYFILGGSHLQVDFVKVVKENGFCAHVIDFDPCCPGAQLADVFHCVSISDLEQVLELAKKHNAKGVHTVATEQGNITACYVAEKMGLIGNSYQTSLNTTDKSLMKKVLFEHNIATPSYQAVYQESELETLSVSYPVIVKASDRSAGRGVSLASCREELFSCYRDAYDQSYNKIVLIEEYFDAPQFSIETLTCNGQHQVVAVTQMGFSGPPDFVETEHWMPASISEALSRQLTEYAFKALNAFDIQTGASHIEVRVAENEIKMIEIASRMGGWRNWMVEASYGVNFLQAIFDSTLGKQCRISTKKTNKLAIVRNIFGKNDYQVYQHEKATNSNIFVDFVKKGSPESNATDLISAHGFYIITKEIV